MPRGLRGVCSLSPLLLGFGCTSNRQVAVTPEPAARSAYLNDHQPRYLRVTTTSGQSAWLQHTVVVGDSLIGRADRDQPPSRRAIALADIRTLEVPEFSAGRTVGLVGGVVGTAGLALLVFATAGSEPVY
jgi:hypothetical protein